MTRAAVTIVEDALDKYVTALGRRGVEPSGIRAKTLAGLAGVSRRKMSGYLQEHRAQGGERYVVACQRYSRDARWKILAKPGSDPKVVQKARRDHAVWVAKDAMSRVANDVAKEIGPSMSGKEWDRVIESESAALNDALYLAVRRMERAMAKLNGGGP